MSCAKLLEQSSVFFFSSSSSLYPLLTSNITARHFLRLTDIDLLYAYWKAGGVRDEFQHWNRCLKHREATNGFVMIKCHDWTSILWVSNKHHRVYLPLCIVCALEYVFLVFFNPTAAQILPILPSTIMFISVATEPPVTSVCVYVDPCTLRSPAGSQCRCHQHH